MMLVASESNRGVVLIPGASERFTGAAARSKLCSSRVACVGDCGLVGSAAKRGAVGMSTLKCQGATQTQCSPGEPQSLLVGRHYLHDRAKEHAGIDQQCSDHQLRDSQTHEDWQAFQEFPRRKAHIPQTLQYVSCRTSSVGRHGHMLV